MKKLLKSLIPNRLKLILKKSYYVLIDLIESIKGRDSMTPPRSMIFVGNGDFAAVGQEFKTYLVDLANLHPDDRVLDAGCGIGRMAIPLTRYLSQDGEYQGFDIVKSGVDWCNANISKKFNNFHFRHSDVFNKHYNPNGTVQAQDFIFPFGDEYFNLIFLTSVFTHMFPADLENYLSEISRVLKSGGKLLITLFIMNKESETLVRSGCSTLDFKYELENCLTTDKNDPEAAIAYEEVYIKQLFNLYGLEIIQPIKYGSWCGRGNYLSYQDIIIASKKVLDKP